MCVCACECTFVYVVRTVWCMCVGCAWRPRWISYRTGLDVGGDEHNVRFLRADGPVHFPQACLNNQFIIIYFNFSLLLEVYQCTKKTETSDQEAICGTGFPVCGLSKEWG